MIGQQFQRCLKEQTSGSVFDQSAGKENGRSISEEIESRLNAMFIAERFGSQVLDLAFGPEPAAVIQLTGNVLRAAGLSALVKRHGMAGLLLSWLDDPAAFASASEALHRFLDALRPPGDATPSLNSGEIDAVLRSLLMAVAHDPETGPLGGVGRRLARTDVGERIKALLEKLEGTNG
jgi:hypothetical protein